MTINLPHLPNLPTDDEARLEIALSSVASPQVLEQLSKDEQVLIRMAVADHPNTSVDTQLDMAAADEDERVVLDRLIHRPDLAPVVAFRLLSVLGGDLRFHLLETISDWGVLREILTTTKEGEDLHALSHNPYLDEFLVELLYETVQEVRRTAPDDMNLEGQDSAEEFAVDLGRHIAIHPSTPFAVHWMLAQESDEDVRTAVAVGTSNLTVIEQLLSDQEETVRFAAMVNLMSSGKKPSEEWRDTHPALPNLELINALVTEFNNIRHPHSIEAEDEDYSDYTEE